MAEHESTNPTPPDAGAPSTPESGAVSDAQNVPTESAEDVAAEALDSATQAVDSLRSEVGLDGNPVDLPDLAGSSEAALMSDDAAGLSMLNDVQLTVKVELGRTRMLVEDVLRLNDHSIVELDKAAGDPVDIFVNGRLVARGEVLVVNENFCVRVSEILADPDDL